MKAPLSFVLTLLLGASTAFAQAGPPQYGGAGGEWLEGGRKPRSSVRITGNLQPRRRPDRYTIREGDTLWDITGRFFGNPRKWPRVWSYNPDITNPHWIYPGDELRLRPEQEQPELPRRDGDDLELVERERADDAQTVYLREQGYLGPEALAKAGSIVGSPAEHMLLAPYDEVYVELADGDDIEAGDELTAFRRYEEEDEQRLEPEQGTLVRIMGTITVKNVDRDEGMVRGVITNALGPIERGYEVADVPRRFKMVPPEPNERSVKTQIVAALDPRELLADRQVVFVPVGENEGIEEGNRFFIVRDRDEWRAGIVTSPDMMGAADPEAVEKAEEAELPTRVVAEARVVDVRPRSATLFITRSVDQVSIGDRAEMREGY